MKSTAVSLIGCMTWLALCFTALEAQTNAPAPAAAPSDAANSAVPADLTAAIQMPVGPDRNKAIGTAVGAWAKSDPIPFYNWLLAQPPAIYNLAAPSSSSAAESTDPKAVAEYLAQHITDKTMMVAHGFTLIWCRHDLPAAQAWALGPSLPANIRYTAIYTVADAMVRKDPTAKSAVDWTMALPAGPNRLAAIDGTICIWTRGDPDAATAWIKTLSPDEMKWAAYTLSGNLRMSKAKATPPDDWLKQLPLSDADRAAIIKGPRPDVAQFASSQPAPAKTN